MSNIELKGLQGLNVLLESEFKKRETETYLKVSVHSLAPCPFQPRKIFKENEINDLAESIKLKGIIQPIITRKINQDKYEIIAGERRWRAAQVAGLQEIPIISRKVNDATALAFALIENVQRKDLNVVDEASAIRTMIEQFSITQEEIAQMLGKGRSTITNLLRTLQLNSKVLEMLANESIELGHAKLLINLSDKEQVSIAKTIIEKSLSVRAAEKLIELRKRPAEQVKVHNPIFNEKLKSWCEYLSKKLHSKVNINFNANGKGRVVINLESSEEMEWLMRKLKNI